MAARKKRKSTRMGAKPKEIIGIAATSEDLFAYTSDGGVYRLVNDDTYGWDELPPITDETIMNLEDDDGDEEEDE